MEDLIKSYQDEITALHRRRQELQTAVRTQHGGERVRTLKRIHTLYWEELDTLDALHMIIKSANR